MFIDWLFQGAAESGSDRNFPASNLVTSDSGPVTAAPTVKRKAEAEFVDEQLPVKKIKSGKTWLMSL